MHRAAAWIAGLALLVQALTLLSAQRYPGTDDHRFSRLHPHSIDDHRFSRLNPHTSLMGGIRPSRSSVMSARCVNPRIYFRNGLVKLRFRGRVVKYVCRPGYSLFGDSVSTCNNGRWDRPVPICAAPGCRLPSSDLLPRGYVENVRSRGVMLRFRCRQGYTLRGGASAFCDGRAWNGSRPSCFPTVPDPDPSCDFEALDQCGWTSDLSGGVQFSRQHDSQDEDDIAAENGTDSVGAPSSPSGHYMALESVGHRLALPDLVLPARLVSPPYRPLRFRACFRFWYRLSCTCTLQLMVWNSTYLSPLWSSYGPRKGGWANVEVPKSNEDFQLVFVARTKKQGEGGVAIDDVRLGPECQDVPTAEPPPATTTLLPDYATTDLDAGDTWETTPIDVGISPAKEDASDSISGKSSIDTASTEEIPATNSAERSSQKSEQTTHFSEVTTQTHSPQTTNLPVSSSSATPKTSYSAASPQTSPQTTTTTTASAGITVFHTSPVTSFLTHSDVATSASSLPSPKPSVATTSGTKSSTFYWLKTASPTTELPTVTRRQSSDAPRPLATTAGKTFQPTSTSPVSTFTRQRTSLEAASSTLASVAREPNVTAFAWARFTTITSAYPSVEGNTVGPEVPPTKVTTSRPSTASSAATQAPTRRTFTRSMTEASKRTSSRFPTTASILPAQRITTATEANGYGRTTSTWKTSTGLPTKAPAVTTSGKMEWTTAAPLTKPTKPKKKATEMNTKFPKWTLKPTKQQKPASTSPPRISASSALPHSSRPVSGQTTSTPRHLHSSQPSSRAPKFVPTESNHLNSDVKMSKPSFNSGTRSKNDEDNEIMQRDGAGIAPHQEKHSAAASTGGGSSWSLPSLLIAAGVILVVMVAATALYRWRRRYRGNADDSEMKPLSKYVDGDPGEVSS